MILRQTSVPSNSVWNFQSKFVEKCKNAALLKWGLLQNLESYDLEGCWNAPHKSLNIRLVPAEKIIKVR